MKDEDKSKAQLIKELADLRRRNKALETIELTIHRANVGLWDLNLQTSEIIVNKRATETLGYTPDEIAPQLSWWDARTHPDDLLRLQSAWRTHMTGQTPLYECEYRLRDKLGEWKWILDRGKIVEWDREGHPIRATGTHLDITERKRVEEALKQSEERFRLVWEIAADAMVLSDPEGIVLAANPAYLRLYGFTPEEVIGQSFAIIFPEDMQSWALEQYKAVFAAEQVPSRFESMIRRADGTDHMVETNIGFITHNGQRTAMLSIIRDITERKQAEETLQQLNRELALLNRASQAFNSSLELDVVLVSLLEEVRPLLGVIGASVWLIDSQNGELVCHQASGAHREMLRGWRLPPGLGIIGWVAQHDQSQIVSDVQNDPRHFKEIEQQLNLKLHSILGVPLRSKEKVIGVLEVVDTVAHRFSQSELMLVESLAATATIAIENARLYEQTRRDAETRAVLLQEVNHRTKNNLAAIIGLLHLEQRHMSDEARSTYQTIMQDLISRIHGLATVHRLLSSADWSPVLLSELVTRVIHSALQALPLDKSVAVEVPPSSIKIAPKLANTIALVINELTTNTVKYAWSARQSGCIFVRLSLDQEEVLLEFRDDGPGFPAEVLRLEHQNVGWELIQTLVKQGLQGKVTLHNDHGAVTTIYFPHLV